MTDYKDKRVPMSIVKMMVVEAMANYQNIEVINHRVLSIEPVNAMDLVTNAIERAYDLFDEHGYYAGLTPETKELKGETTS